MTHFDHVKDYDTVLPGHITHYFLEKKGKIIIRTLAERADVTPGLRGLDLGCGTGDMVNLVSERIASSFIIGMDNSRQQLLHAGRKYPESHFALEEMTSLPFSDEAFDFVMATNSLHHMASREEQKRAIAEVHRVLKSKGIFIVNEMNTKNPLIWLYWRYVFPRFREFELGNETRFRSCDLTSFEILDTVYYTFVPDFCPSFLFGLARRIDRLLDRTPLSILGCHVTIVAIKP